MERTATAPHVDRRSARTRVALRDALASEIEATGDLTQVTVTAVTDRADVTRRTFYSHYRDIPDLVRSIEDEAISDLRPLVTRIADTTLDELSTAVNAFTPCPGTEDLLAYFVGNASYLPALLGDGGDPAFDSRIRAMVREVALPRARQGFAAPVPTITDTLLDYYLTFAISAEVGVLERWLTTGMHEGTHSMACMMTALMFVRPGDLYGRPIGFDIPKAASAMVMQRKEASHG